MRAWQLESFGAAGLRAVGLPVPQPKDGEALVRVRAVSLNYRDLLVLRGFSRWRRRLPHIPATDAAGEVAAVATGVKRVKTGDRVAVTFVPGWIDGELTAEKDGPTRDGMLAQFVTVSQDSLVHLPDGMSFEEAACLPCAAVTAWNALFVAHRIRPNESLVVLGSGSVSLSALQFGRLAGARVYAVTGSREKTARLRRLGAVAVIDRTRWPQWPERLLQLTGGRGVDQVVETVGGTNLAKSLRALRMGGTITAVGMLESPRAVIQVPELYSRLATVQGIQVGSRAMFEEMLSTMSAAEMRPVIDRTFQLSDVPRAFRRLASGKQFGKVVIRL